MVDEADQNILSDDPRLLFQCGNEAAVSPITAIGRQRASVASGLFQDWHRAPEDGRIEPGLVAQSLDEVRGAAEKHLLDLRYVLGPEWRVSSEMMSGETVSCVIAGPRRLTLQCEAASPLALSVLAAEISREYGAVLPVSCIRIQTTACLPAKVQTRVQWD